MFIAAPFRIAKLWYQPRYPTTNERIKKLWYAIKKNKIKSLQKMNGAGDYHVKWNKLGSEKQTLHVFSYMGNLDVKPQNKTKLKTWM
jgi:hypothetical protein